MKKIALVTDSNSGITQEMGKTMGIHVIPMPFFIDGELFLEDITLTQEEFYKRISVWEKILIFPRLSHLRVKSWNAGTSC